MSLNWLGIGLELSFSSNTFSGINAIKLYRRISNALLFCPNLWSKRQQKSRQRHLSAISDMSQGQYLFSAITATSLSLQCPSFVSISSSSSLFSLLPPLLPSILVSSLLLSSHTEGLQVCNVSSNIQSLIHTCGLLCMTLLM